MAAKGIPGYADARNTIYCGFGGVQYGIINEGTGAPTNSVQGYEHGALWFQRDGTTAADALWVNLGTESSSSWAIVPMNSSITNRLVASGASLTVSAAVHDQKIIVLAAAAAITLPAFTGSGAVYTFICGATATAVTITATGAYLFGKLWMNTDAAFQAGTLFTVGAAVSTAGSTTITLDGSTKGGNIGDMIQIVDIASNKGAVRGDLNASGTEATPFS